uniref:Uncharacterized protein n=1 Tax=Anguilla anguilla TaxID=7936 RepID=A0A0E9TF39_ANGAN
MNCGGVSREKERKKERSGLRDGGASL